MPAKEQHLVHIDDGWGLWRTIWLRSSGFPAADVLQLATPGCLPLIDDLIAREDLVESRRAAAEAAVRAALQREPSDLLRKLAKRLAARDVPEPPESASAEVHEPLLALSLAHRAAEEQRELAQAALVADNRTVGEVLRAIAQDPRFREALLWQNRNAIHEALAPLLRHAAGASDSKTRQKERLVASYVQRYCTKNDTIGFFGPVGWASLDERCASLSVEPGAEFLSKRTVYFEHWAIDALAETLSKDPELAPYLAPRRVPSIRLEGSVLFYSSAKRTELPPLIARVLHACDGETPAIELARALLEDEALELEDESEVYELLSDLADKKMITWALEIPPLTSYPERALRTQLERVSDGEIKARSLAPLDALEDARKEIAQSAGDPLRLERAIDALDAIFERVTGLQGRRRGGQAYAGRSLFFEDCVRDVRCEVGRDLIQRLSKPLALLFASARWYTSEIARAYQSAMSAAYDDLAKETGNVEVDYQRYAERVDPLLSPAAGTPELVRAVIDEVHTRWSRILAVDAGSRSITRSSASIEAAVKNEFAAPGPGWPTARYHSPDIMIAAESVEAIQRGELKFVLGEVHVSVNSIFSLIGLSQYPRLEELHEAAARDIPNLLLTPIQSKSFVNRADAQPMKPGDPQLEIGATRSPLPRKDVVAIADLIVTRDGGAPCVRTRDGRLRYDLLSFFGWHLVFAAFSGLPIIRHTLHTPRVTIDELVVQRESWTIPVSELGFVAENDLFRQLSGARRWAKKLELPRFLFVKVSTEPKPFYLDLESAIYVDIFARKVRGAETVTISEMLPGLDQLWLTDRQGRSYTCELRIAGVDPRAYGEGQ